MTGSSTRHIKTAVGASAFAAAVLLWTFGSIAAAADASHADEGSEGLTSVLLDRPAVPVTRAAFAVAEAPAPRQVTEGLVIDRRCRLKADGSGQWHIVEFLDGDDAPMPLLPCLLMQKAVELAGERSGQIFTVSGETYAYEGRFYLLLRRVTSENEHAQPSAQPDPPADTPEPSAASPESILNKLLVGRPDKPVLMPANAPLESLIAEEPVVGPSDKVLMVPRGFMLADRLVRILPEQDGQWLIARFEADNSLAEPPVRLLPCKMLQQAERVDGGGGIKLRVSGELTECEGRQYLLLQRIHVERNLGQF